MYNQRSSYITQYRRIFVYYMINLLGISFTGYPDKNFNRCHMEMRAHNLNTGYQLFKTIQASGSVPYQYRLQIIFAFKQ